MPKLRELMNKFLADGKIDPREVEVLGDLLYTDRKIDRTEAEFLIELQRRVERVSPAFEKFYFKALKQFILSDGVIAPDMTDWLRHVIFADGKVAEREKKLLGELNGEAADVCDEFETLFQECVNQR